MWEQLWQWLFPDVCVGCDRAGALLCRDCLAAAPTYHDPLPTLGVDRVWVAYAYEGVVREALLVLKYSGQRRMAPVLGAALAARVPPGYVGVLAIPAAPSRVVQRGYDQAVLLAAAVARHHGVPLLTGLSRRRDTCAQAKLDRVARAQNVADAFVWRGPPVRGRVLVIDDICTTGATLQTAVETLRAAGFVAIDVAVVARGHKKTSRP